MKHCWIVGTRTAHELDTEPYAPALFVFLLSVAGDALQLGPVYTARQVLDTPVYDSRTFRDTFVTRYGHVVVLTGSHRQVRDSWFVECLDRIRMGKMTESDVRTLNATSDGVSDEEWASRTQLRAVNRDVNSFNAQKLASLPGPEVTYACRDEVNERITHPNRVAYAMRRLGDVAAPAVTVKPGAVVLLTRAVAHVASGTQGIVVYCCESHVICSFGGVEVRVHFVSFDVVDNCNVRLASRFALPLVLGWAMTIHRAQGTTLDTLAIDFTHLNWREPGLAYSGLSRCRLLENLYVRGLRMHCVVASENAMSFMPSIRVVMRNAPGVTPLFVEHDEDAYAIHWPGLELEKRGQSTLRLRGHKSEGPTTKRSAAPRLALPLRRPSSIEASSRGSGPSCTMSTRSSHKKTW